jgi:flagellar motor switch protein FliM
MTSPLINHRSREASSALPKVETFFQMASARLRSRLVSRSASDIPVRVSGVEVRTLSAVAEEEFSGGVIVGEIRLGNGLPPGLVLIQHNLLTRLIAVLLGEELDGGGSLSQFRALTPVERRIAGRICQDLSDGLEHCWPEPGGPSCQFTGLLSPSVLSEPVSTSTPVFTAMLDFGQVGSALGLMAVAIPVAAFPTSDAPRRDTSRPRGGSLESMMPVELEVVVELTRLKLTVNNLRALQVGEVVPLGTLRDAVVKVNGMPLFEGQAGVSNGVRSVRLVRRRSG